MHTFVVCVCVKERERKLELENFILQDCSLSLVKILSNSNN